MKFELEQVKTEIENEIFKNEIAVASHRAKKGNAAIARQIGNASGALMLAKQLTIDQKRPLYLSGYKALEKKIALLDAGTGIALLPFIDKYPELAFRKRNLETDTRLERISQALILARLIQVKFLKQSILIWVLWFSSLLLIKYSFRFLVP